MAKFINQNFFLLYLSFSGSSSGVVKFSDHTKYISLKTESCLARTVLTDINLNEFHYYSCMTSLDRCNGSCNTLDALSSKVQVSNKREDVNLNVFHMITGINE